MKLARQIQPITLIPEERLCISILIRPKTTFQILSDLHLETPLTRPSYEDFAAEITLWNSYLALLGDIGYARDTGLHEFLEGQLQHFQIVCFLLDNHEAYGTSLAAAKALVKAFAARMETMRGSSTMGRFAFLNQTRYDMGEEITVLACTLSRISEEQANTVKMFVTDFSSIESWEINDPNEAHSSD